MAFFDDPEPQEPEVVHESPPWAGPPVGELAVLVADRRVLVRGDDTAVVLSHVDVYTTGCSLRVRASLHRAPGTSERDWQDQTMAFHHERGVRPGRASDGPLRFGIELPDGRRATTERWAGSYERPPDGPVLAMHGGGGTGGPEVATVNHNLWLWPLPPAEPFDMVLEWRAMGIAETWVQLEGEAIVAAAADVRPLLG